ncbi:MAG: hypothetical protein Q4G34_06975 [Micrococcus sp.]|nr:hypothetical protein [Micrococcus sp.]
MTSTLEPHGAQSTYAVRRAPRLGVFFILGALSGALLGVVVGLLLHAGATPPLDPFTGYPLALSSTLSITVIVCLILGLLLGAIAWLITDRRSRRRTSTYVLEATEDPAEADLRLHRGDVANYTDRWSGSPRKDTTP